MDLRLELRDRFGRLGNSRGTERHMKDLYYSAGGLTRAFRGLGRFGWDHNQHPVTSG